MKTKIVAAKAKQEDNDEDFEDYDSSDDSDYDAIADCDLYDSKMDKIDELMHTRDTL